MPDPRATLEEAAPWALQERHEVRVFVSAGFVVANPGACVVLTGSSRPTISDDGLFIHPAQDVPLIVPYCEGV